jgi:hypothetical protein
MRNRPPPAPYDRVVTVSDDHDDLPTHAEVLLRRLDELSALFAPAEVAYGQHMQFAQRCEVLSDHLKGVLDLSARYRYAAALAVTRTALEHHLVDRLMFLADRWVVEISVKAENVEAEKARLSALKAGKRPEFMSWRYEKAQGVIDLVVRGFFMDASVGRITVSPYYLWVYKYDPFAVKKRSAPHVAMGFRDPDAELKWAEESKDVWDRRFVLGALRKNLVANRLLRPRLGVQVDVHYAFLSAFVHGVQGAYERVHGYNIPNRLGTFDHYASELALLYVVAIAAAELEMFGRMAKREPRLELREWSAVEAEVAAARTASSYFWFLSGEPTMYDRIQQVHSRKPILTRTGTSKRLRTDPASLNSARVKYYRNPFDRLVALHQTSMEMLTGHTFRSPFERPQAGSR